MGEEATGLKASISLLMEQVTTFYQANNAQKGKAQLGFIADFAQQQLGNNSISATIGRHFEGIVSYFDTHLTNGLLEGINSKTQAIKRLARGFRYKENFKKLIRFVFQSNPFSSNFIKNQQSNPV